MARRAAKKSTKNKISVPLGDRRIEIARELWSLDQFKLDPHNPRLSSSLRMASAKSAANEAELHARLWKMPQVQALARSIEQNRGLLEDPIVRADGTVIEGNCRIVALRELARENPKEKCFREVHARVLPGDVTAEQISLLLGDLHIAQKIQWSAFDQAEYVWRMHREQGKSLRSIATHLRWTRVKVTQKLDAYEETRAFAERTGDLQAFERFPLFEELMKKQELRNLREDDPGFMKRFGDWIEKGKIKRTKDVSDLPDILEDDEAREAFLKRSMKAAREVLLRHDPSRASTLYWFLDRTAEKLETIPLTEVEAIRDGDKARVQLIRRLSKAVTRLEKETGLS